MRKSGLMLAMIAVLAGVSVQAVKSSAQVRLTPTNFRLREIVIQDDNGRGFLLFDPASGVYKSTLCESSFAVSGTGQIKIDGCNIHFSDIQTAYRIFATVNMCDHEAKCAFEILLEPNLRVDVNPLLESWSDTDMRDSTAECGTQSK